METQYAEKQARGRTAKMQEGKNRCVYLDNESMETARELGGGNTSEGIRVALRQAKKMLEERF